jgi:hypothetical protein
LGNGKHGLIKLRWLIARFVLSQCSSCAELKKAGHKIKSSLNKTAPSTARRVPTLAPHFRRARPDQEWRESLQPFSGRDKHVVVLVARLRWQRSFWQTPARERRPQSPERKTRFPKTSATASRQRQPGCHIKTMLYVASAG